jgi:ligand-binding sensor domain-containing protein
MKPYTVKDGLPDRTVTNIIKDRHGYLWFGTLSGGVVRYMPGMD